MSRARQCSRCEKLYVDYHTESPYSKDNFNAIQTLDRDLDNRHFSRKTFDLCPDCKESFVKWLDITN